MKKYSLLISLVCFSTVLFCQSPATITGTVKDEQTGSALEGATLSLDGSKHATLSDRYGNFKLSVSKGNHRLTITYIGYLAFSRDIIVTEGENKIVNAFLIADIRPGHEVVISAFLKPEKNYEAAAAIYVINRKSFERHAGSNPLELMASVPGIEYTRNGVSDITFNARGLHTAFNNRVLQIVDGRNSMSSLSGSLPIMNRGTLIKDDIERLEVVLGPQSAIFGPNAHNAVFNFVTKDPRKHSGTSLSTSVGSRSQFSARLRHAHVINSKWAYKLTGEQVTGKEYEFYDSVYAGNQTGTTPYFGAAVAIPMRIKDLSFRHIRGEASLYYTLKPGNDLILSGGGSEHTWPQVTTGGRNQMLGVVYSYAQARFISKNWYASIYNTWGSLGKSYGLAGYTRDYWNRTHSSLPPSDTLRGRLYPDEAEVYALRNRFKENSQRTNAELRYNRNIHEGLFVALGSNFQEERPNGYGNTLIDSFTRIRVRQVGASAQVEKHLPFKLRFIAATRIDHHQNFGEFLSPRVAVVKEILGGNLRASWSRAYSMPTILNQYSGINRSSFGNGYGVLYIPNDSNFYDEKSRRMTDPLQPERISTWETGYKGSPLKSFYIDISFYYGTSKNFISPPRSVYGRAIEVNGIPVWHDSTTAGSVGSDNILRNARFTTYFNYGEVKAYGVDLAIRYLINHKLNAVLNYSWFGSDITSNDMKNDANLDNFVSLEETSLNAPQNRASLTFQYERILNKRWGASLSARFIERYDFYSGVQIGTAAGKGKRGEVFAGFNQRGDSIIYRKNFDHGPLGGFVTIDLNTGYDFNDNIRLNIGVTNLLNTKQIEFAGSPSIRRLLMAELRLRVF